jgi:hypothetical protein
MNRYLYLLSLLITLVVGLFIGAGLGASQQLRLDIARFSENARGWHKAIASIDGVPQKIKDDPLFTLQGFYIQQNQGVIELGAFSPSRFVSLLSRTDWETKEAEMNREYLKEHKALPNF